jgi:ABC-type multidrug transport system ATPase subunit
MRKLILIASHMKDDLVEICDNIIILDNGKVIQN